MIIIFMLVCGCVSGLSSESISTQAWSNLISDLALKIHDYKLDDKTIETQPLTEGFILLYDNLKKPSPTKPSIINRISAAHNTSSTTCITITTTKIANNTSSSTAGHVGRRLLYEESYDTDIETSSKQIPIDDDGEVESFLKVDDEELNKQLLNTDMTTDGSGETTELTSETTITSLVPETSQSTTISSTTTETLIAETTITSVVPETSQSTTTSSTTTETSIAETTITSLAPETSQSTTTSSTTTETSIVETTITSLAPETSQSTTTSSTTAETSIVETTITSVVPETSQSTTTSSTTTSSTITPPQPAETLSFTNATQIMIILNCANANETLIKILNILYANNNIPRPDIGKWQCTGTETHRRRSVLNLGEAQGQNQVRLKPLSLTGSAALAENVNVSLNFTTNNNITTINDVLQAVENATANLADAYRVNICNDNELVLIKNVTSCYIINECRLCGVPERGVCQPNTGTKCTCFENYDASRPYRGDRCNPIEPETVIIASPSRWTPVIVGVLAGLAGLFLAMTCCLWAVAAWRHRNPANKDLRIHRLWHLPRAQLPKTVTNENVPNYLNNTISTLSSRFTESDHNGSNITDSTFFKELDQKMGENLRATVARPNTRDMLASLPADSESTLSSYDPIDELDAIIDNEDIEMTFHDSLNDLYEDNEMLEIVNPNLKLPRPNIDSKPTGLFSRNS